MVHGLILYHAAVEVQVLKDTTIDRGYSGQYLPVACQTGICPKSKVFCELCGLCNLVLTSDKGVRSSTENICEYVSTTLTNSKHTYT